MTASEAIVPGQTLSVSRLKAFAACPFRAARKYVTGIPEPDTEPAVFGKAVHEVVRQAGEHFVSTGTLPDRKTITAWVKAQEAAAASTDLLTKTALGEIGKLSRRAIAVLDEIPTGATVLVEHHGQVPIPDRPGHELQMYADLVYITPDGKEGVIVDFKTSRKPYEVDQDPAHQLPIYAWVLSQRYPEVERWTLRLVFLRTEAVSKREYTTALRDEALGYLTSETDRVIGLYAAGEFPATPGAVCEGCPAAMQCPVANGEAPLEFWGSDDAAALFGAQLAVEAKLKLITGTLRPYVQANGPVHLGGEYAGLYGKPSLCFPDKAAVMQILSRFGKDPMEYMELDQTRFRKLAEAELELAAAGEWKTPALRFEHRDTAPDEANAA